MDMSFEKSKKLKENYGDFILYYKLVCIDMFNMKKYLPYGPHKLESVAQRGY